MNIIKPRKKIETDILNKLVGIPWKEDGRDFSGADCTGLMELYCRLKGIKAEAPKISEAKNWPPEKIAEDMRNKNHIISISEIEPGDILVFNINNELHVGLYIGYNKMLHATKDKMSRTSRLTQNWANYFVFAIRAKNGRIYVPPAGPPAAIAAVAYVADVVVATALGMGLAEAMFYAIGTAFIGYSIGLAIQAKNQQKSLGSPRYRFGELRTTASNQYPWPMIYGGGIRLAGNIIYQDPPEGGEKIDILLGVGEGKIHSITDVRLNGEPIANFPGCTYQVFLGTSTQNVETDTGLDLDGIQFRNKAIIYLHLETSDKLKGRPNVTYIVEGREISTWDGSSWTTAKSYSDNPAACIRDYLITRLQRGGCGLTAENLNDSDWGEAFDDCDELVSDGAGGTEKRYTMSYVIDQKRPAADNLAEMLVGCAGTIFRSGAQYKLIIAKEKSAVASFTEDNIKDLKITQRSLDDKINRLNIEYFDPDQNDAKILVPGPQDREDQAERGLVPLDLTIPSISRKTHALRLCNQYFYERKLCPLGCEFTTSLNAIENEVGDVVKLTHSLMNWTEKLFIVIGMEELEQNVYKISCQEYNPTIYNDRYGASIETFNYGTPANPYAPVTDVTNLVITESTIYLHKDGTVSSDIDVSWDGPTDDTKRFLSHYQIEIKKGSADYKAVHTTIDNSYKIIGVEEGVTYKVRIKTVSTNNIISSGTESNSLDVVGKDAPPSDISWLSVSFSKNKISFSWEKVTDADLKGYEIRELPFANAEWELGTIIDSNITENSYELFTLTTGTKYYAVKALDRSGNYSENFAIDSITITSLPESNVIKTQDFNLKTGTIEGNIERCWMKGFSENYYKIGLSLFGDTEWDGASNWDSTFNMDKPEVNVKGTYVTDVVDLGSIQECNIVLDLGIQNVAGGALNLLVAYSDSDSTPDNWTNFVSGQFSGRYFRFKIEISSTSGLYGVDIYRITASFDVPDLIQEALNQDVLGSGWTQFDLNGFTEVRSLIVSSVGAHVVEIEKDGSDIKGLPAYFNVRLLDPANAMAQVAGSINVYAKGY